MGGGQGQRGVEEMQRAYRMASRRVLVSPLVIGNRWLVDWFGCRAQAPPKALPAASVRFRTKSLGTNLCYCCSKPKRPSKQHLLFACDAICCEGYASLSVSCRGMSHPHRERSESCHVWGCARLVSGRMLSCEGLCSCRELGHQTIRPERELAAALGDDEAWHGDRATEPSAP